MSEIPATEKAGGETRTRLLDAAERLFARHGIDATSLRKITSEAHANLAAVNYHFGSKEALIREVFLRRLHPMNEERLAALDRLERESGEKGPSLEEVLRAFYLPALTLCSGLEREGSDFRRLLARVWSEPRELLRPIFASEFRTLAERFQAALARCLPGASSEDLRWGIFFLVGILTHGLQIPNLDPQDPPVCLRPGEDVEATLARMVRFGAGGLRALVREDDGCPFREEGGKREGGDMQ